MRKILYGLLAIGLSLGLAACSDDKKKLSKHETQGLIATAVLCSADPRRYAEAEPIADIDDGGGCHVYNAFKVQSISHVALNQSSVLNCSVVQTTGLWLQRIVQPAAEDQFGERVVKIEVPSAYACRTRNSVRGAKLSEHAKGNAIDVSAFILASGRRVSVLKDWNGSRDARNFLRNVRAEACGPFKTVLGPGSDMHHKDHLHLDLQRHRSGGSYCR